MYDLDFSNNTGKWSAIYWDNKKADILHSLSERKGRLFAKQIGPIDGTDDVSTSTLQQQL